MAPGWKPRRSRTRGLKTGGTWRGGAAPGAPAGHPSPRTGQRSRKPPGPVRCAAARIPQAPSGGPVPHSRCPDVATWVALKSLRPISSALATSTTSSPSRPASALPLMLAGRGWASSRSHRTWPSEPAPAYTLPRGRRRQHRLASLSRLAAHSRLLGSGPRGHRPQLSSEQSVLLPRPQGIAVRG